MQSATPMPDALQPIHVVAHLWFLTFHSASLPQSKGAEG